MSIMQGSFFFSLSKIVNVCGWKFKHVNTLAKLPPHNNGLVESGCMYQVNENQFISTDFQKQINHHSSCNRNVNDSVSHFSTWMWFFRRCNFFFFFHFFHRGRWHLLRFVLVEVGCLVYTCIMKGKQQEAQWR